MLIGIDKASELLGIYVDGSMKQDLKSYRNTQDKSVFKGAKNIE